MKVGGGGGMRVHVHVYQFELKGLAGGGVGFLLCYYFLQRW